MLATLYREHPAQDLEANHLHMLTCQLKANCLYHWRQCICKLVAMLLRSLYSHVGHDIAQALKVRKAFCPYPFPLPPLFPSAPFTINPCLKRHGHNEPEAAVCFMHDLFRTNEPQIRLSMQCSLLESVRVGGSRPGASHTQKPWLRREGDPASSGIICWGINSATVHAASAGAL